MTVTSILTTLFICILIYLALLSAWYTVLLVISFPEVIKKFKESRYGNIHQLIDEEIQIPITVVTPAFNEEKRIVNMIQGVFNSNYKHVKLIIVNDGSTDGMMALLEKEYSLYEVPLIIKQHIKTSTIKRCYKSLTNPNLTVIDKEHSPYGCAADAVNAGLNACQTPIMLTIDADTILEPEALSRLLFTFLSRSHCVAASGAVYVLNSNVVENGKVMTTNLPSRFIPAVQSVEYLGSFLYGRSALNVLGGALCFPGAFTLFETEILHDVGGFDTPNFAYDAEIITKLHHHMRKNNYPYKISYSSNASCWTEVPSTFTHYWKQRAVWQRGMWRTVTRHIGMLFNPKFGIVGMLTFPSYILFDILGPVVECVSWILFIIALWYGLVSVPALLWFLLLAWGFVTFIATAMIFLNIISFNKYAKPIDVLKSAWLVFVEMFGFRQARALCCTLATVRYCINRMLGKPI